MKRRKFIRTASTIASAPMILDKTQLLASNTLESPMYHAMAQKYQNCGKVLVIIQMAGGNDGLNMIIPIDKWSNLNNGRSSIIIPEHRILALNGNTTNGFHPAMTELQSMHDRGKLAFVQAVSYANPSFSHFRATDIWNTGSNSGQFWETGWLGRYIETDFQGAPDGYPNAEMPDPFAIQIGTSLPLTLQGTEQNLSYSAPNPSSLINVGTDNSDPATADDYGAELTYIRNIKAQSNSYVGRIQAAYAAATTQSTLYPTPSTSLADGLKIIARLIKGGLQTPIYIITQGRSYDTHTNQVNSTDHTIGNHATYLGELSRAIGAFQDDLEKMQIDHKVAGMTFSEFGRRIISNASVGTDHGSSAPVIVFGSGVNPGMFGTSPNIPVTPTVNDQIPMQHDFRRIYADVLKNWFCLSQMNTDAVLGATFAPVGVFRSSALPVKLISFDGEWMDRDVMLHWQAYASGAVEGFEVLRSDDGTHFTRVGRVKADGTNGYHFRDIQPSKAIQYYKLRMIEIGTYDTESEMIRVAKINNRLQFVKLLPNPWRRGTPLSLQFSDAETGDMQLTIMALNGRVMWRHQTYLQDSLYATIPLTNQLNTGIYVAQVMMPTGPYSFKFIVA
jgi:uncharacterized protein (DUF1501 family)